MCFVAFISCSEKLPLIPWDKSDPGFNVRELSSYEAPVKQHFSLPYVAYAGSHFGCGCGFLKEDANSEELSDTQSSYDSLANYITGLSKNGAQCSLYFLWDGDHALEPDFFEQLTISELTTPEFEFVEGAHYEFA